MIPAGLVPIADEQSRATNRANQAYGFLEHGRLRDAVRIWPLTEQAYPNSRTGPTSGWSARTMATPFSGWATRSRP